jgi:hypothetical protein
MWGADPDELNRLAASFGTGAATFEQIGSSLGASLQSTTWTGTDADTFRSDWSHVHLPALSAVVGVLRDLVSLLHKEAAQQQSASAADGSAGLSVGGYVAGAAAAAAGAVSGAMAISNKVGWFVSPLLGHLRGVGPLQTADQVFRGGQDVLEGHYQAAFDEGTGDGASVLMTKGGVGFLAGTDAIIIQHDVQAYRAIDWSYTVSHLSELNPTAPGAMHAVLQSEAQGFGSLGADIGKSAVGAVETLL